MSNLSRFTDEIGGPPGPPPLAYAPFNRPHLPALARPSRNGHLLRPSPQQPATIRRAAFGKGQRAGRERRRGEGRKRERERKKQQEGKPTRKIEYQLKTWRSLRRDNVTRYVAGRGMRHLVARSVARNGVGWHELGLARAYELPRRCDPTVLLGATCSLLCAISVSCVAT